MRTNILSIFLVPTYCSFLNNNIIPMEVCRLCLQEEKPLIKLFSNKIDEDFLNKIKNCVSIKINNDDSFPTAACELCIQKVNNWYNFKEMCLKSNETLINQSKNNSIKPKNYKKISTNPKELAKEERPLKSEDFSDIFIVEDDNFSSEKDILLVPEELQRHLVVDNVYECEICQKEFKNCFDFLDHQVSHDGEIDVFVFTCDKCPEKFSTRQELVEHDQNHKRPCPICEKMVLKSSMKLHLIRHTDKHLCPHCPSRCNSRASLAQHIITLHTDRKDHICETCGKRFSSKSAINVHQKSHSNQRLYSCKICEYAGRTASGLYIHMSTHAKDVCICEVCSKVFKSNRNLYDHLRRVHCKERKYQCSYCDKKFIDNYKLQVHIRCHTGVRPYSCKLCEKAFNRSDGLKEHMITHEQKVVYDCEKCEKKFSSKRGVIRHLCHGYK